MDPRQQEVVEKISRLVNKEFAGSFRQAFDYFDSNSDGKISVPELAALLYRAQIGSRITRWHWCKEIIDALDVDLDDNISWSEFERNLIEK